MGQRRKCATTRRVHSAPPNAILNCSIGFLYMKVYDSIPHLAGSNRGTDALASCVTSDIATGVRSEPSALIFVSEKVDGSCTGVLRRGDRLVAMTRSGARAADSQALQLRLFAQWVDINQERFFRVLEDGELMVGEWLLQAHGTRYRFYHEPYMVHDIFNEAHDSRLAYRSLQERILPGQFLTPELLYVGASGISIREAGKLLGHSGFLGALDGAEGMVWRIERRNRQPMLVKFVRPEFTAGQFMFALGRPTRPEPYWNVATQSIYTGRFGGPNSD